MREAVAAIYVQAVQRADPNEAVAILQKRADIGGGEAVFNAKRLEDQTGGLRVQGAQKQNHQKNHEPVEPPRLLSDGQCCDFGFNHFD